MHRNDLMSFKLKLELEHAKLGIMYYTFQSFDSVPLIFFIFFYSHLFLLNFAHKAFLVLLP